MTFKEMLTMAEESANADFGKPSAPWIEGYREGTMAGAYIIKSLIAQGTLTDAISDEIDEWAVSRIEASRKAKRFN